MDNFEDMFEVCNKYTIPSRYLPVQSQQEKYQKNVRNLLKVNNKNIKTKSLSF